MDEIMIGLAFLCGMCVGILITLFIAWTLKDAARIKAKRAKLYCDKCKKIYLTTQPPF